MSATQPRPWGAYSGQRYGSFAGKPAALAPVPVRTTQPRAWGLFSGQRYGSFAGKPQAIAPIPVQSIPTWYYTPGAIPMDAPAWIVQELQSVSRSSYGAAPFLQLQVQYAEPAKLRDGMVVLADGTSWDPGSGAGIYARIASAWVQL